MMRISLTGIFLAEGNAPITMSFANFRQSVGEGHNVTSSRSAPNFAEYKNGRD